MLSLYLLTNIHFMKILPILLTLFTSVAQAQEFPFSISKLTEMQHISLDSINKIMLESKMIFNNAADEDESNLPMVSYRLPSGIDFERSVAWIDFEYGAREVPNRILVDLGSITFHYNKLLDELVNLGFQVIKAYKNKTGTYNDAGLIYQNKHTTVYCFLRDHSKIEQSSNGKNNSDHTYHFWVVANSDYDEILKRN